MTHQFAELAFTPAVQAFQEQMGSRKAYAKAEGGPVQHDRLGKAETAFIQARDSFYMATVSETGWPYIQHRGGPAGFVRVLDEKTLGFADYRGNRQYISLGNLSRNDRVALFFMDYPDQRASNCSAERGRLNRMTSRNWRPGSRFPIIRRRSSAAFLSRSRPSTGTARSISRRASPQPRSPPLPSLYCNESASLKNWSNARREFGSRKSARLVHPAGGACAKIGTGCDAIFQTAPECPKPASGRRSRQRSRPNER